MSFCRLYRKKKSSGNIFSLLVNDQKLIGWSHRKNPNIILLNQNVYNMKLCWDFQIWYWGTCLSVNLQWRFFLLLFQGFKRVHAPVNGNCWEDTSDRAIFNANPRELSSLIVIKVIIAILLLHSKIKDKKACCITQPSARIRLHFICMYYRKDFAAFFFDGQGI